tara:strand:- start:1230 stop:1598 length:369 start_codon:yes stop_codon:yes gene_type:complete
MLILIKGISVYVMGIFYIIVGIKHFQDPSWFVQIVPPILPYKYELVYISGFFEILLGILLMIPRFQSIAAKGLMALLICVYPANIYLAQTNGVALGISPLIAWGRLPFQFVFIGLAYWHLKE